MERNREARRASVVCSDGFNRRRHRSNSLRDSPDEDSGLEFQESGRLRDRVKKDRERERDREHERERERDLRDTSSRSKRRRDAERLTSNREEIGEDETSEESVNDDEIEEDDENTAASGIVVPLTPATGYVPNHNHNHHAPPPFINHHNNHHGHNNSSSFTQQHNSPIITPGVSHHIHHRKSFPLASSSSKATRAPPVWKPGDEMISVSVPRKARSVSTKRSHDWVSNNSGGVTGGEQILRQASDCPIRQGLASSSTPSPAAPVSPSSSNASARKKLKHSGAKLKPPKVSAKPSSSNPEELEIEIAEVLYGLMTQSQAPPPSKNEETKDVYRSNSDAKSRNSSPISHSTSANPTSGPNFSPLSAVAPKKKRPRQIPENSSHGGARSSPMTEMAAKPDADQTTKSESSSHALEKIPGAAVENGYEMGGNSVVSNKLPVEPASMPESTKLDSEVKKTVAKELAAEEAVISPKEKEAALVIAEESGNLELPSLVMGIASLGATVINSNSVVSDLENHKEEKIDIDLMASPMVDLRVDQKPVLRVIDQDKEARVGIAPYGSKLKWTDSEAEPYKVVESKRREINLQLDLEKPGRDVVGGVGVVGSKFQPHFEKQQEMQVKGTRGEAVAERSDRTMTANVSLPMSLASWPNGFPPMGYMALLPGVVSMDGSPMTPTPIQPLFSQPPPKRCATHCHIARNIHCLQQFMKMNPFLSAPTASKPCNLNVIPAADLQGSIAGRGVGNVQDKGQCVSTGPGNNGKEKDSQQAGAPDSAQKKQQICFPQTMPPVASTNLLGPTFVFPLNQQQTAMPARPGVPIPSLVATSSNNSSSAGASASSPATAVSFNYPNVAANESQYLAILPNHAYPFPIPAVGAPPNYRGAPGQTIPLFNGSFYSSQLIHPSQYQLPQQPPSTQAQQLLQVQQNMNTSSGSSAPQKHSHNLQQRPHSSGVAGASGSISMQNFPAPKGQQSQQMQSSQNQYMHSSPPGQYESEVSEDGRATTDNWGSRASKNIYGPNFVIPLHPQNYAMLTPSASLATVATSGNSTDKSHQTQQPVSKGGVESVAPQSFAMSFGPINGANTGPGIDMSAMSHNHVLFKNTSEASRHNIHMMAAAAAQVAQQKNFQIPEDGRLGPSGSSTTDDDRRNFSGKALGGGGQSIAFRRSELGYGAAASIQASSVIESSSQSHNVASSASQGPRPVMASDHIKFQSAHIQSQMQQQMLQQLKHQQPQQQMTATSVSRNKVPSTSNVNVYPEHLNSFSAMAAKFPDALSGFPPNLVQSNSSTPVQSTQWKSSTRAATSQAPSSLGSSGGTPLKVSQQHLKTQSQMHTQISFGGSQKQSSMSSGQAPPINDQSPCSPMMVGSPTNSISRGGSGSPRTESASNASNKMCQASSLSSQQAKNSPSNPRQKSPSVLGNPHVTSSSSSNSAKAQMLQQQQLQKAMQPMHLFFSNPYHSQPPPAGTSATTTNPNGYYMQRRWPDQHQQPEDAPVTSSTGMLSLCPPSTLASSSTNDPAKAMAAATCNIKGGRVSSQGIIQAFPFSAHSPGTMLPAGFPNTHPVPAVVQVKSAELKQATGHDSVHTWQAEKK